MNVSQPIASYIGSVDFRFLSSEDIKALSVKKIQNPTTFDTLLHPVPGGLYDASLGAWSDNPCATCHLNTYSCPGHVGHIELPVPVYHVTFMDQLLRLLRAKCAYCSHLRLPPTEVNRFICKLRLIVHGLAREVEELENIHLGSTAKKLRGEAAMDVDGESEESEEEDEETLKQRRNEFVRRAIKEKGGRNVRDTVASEKVESVSEVRRNIVKEFLATITKIKTCGTCKGVSPGFRKDRYSKIFRKPLNKKDKANMVQGGFKAVNPLVRAANERKAAQKQKREDREIDEGIVIDSDEITSDGEGEGRDIDMLDIEDEDAPTAVLEESAALRLSKIKVKDEPPDEYVNAQEIHASISELFHKEREIMELVYNHRATKNAKPISAEMFFIRDILVPPNKYRPEAKTGDGEIAEAQENQLYKNILAQCELLNQIRKEMSGSAPDTPYRRRDFRDLQNVWVRLQDAVNSMIDSDRNPLQGTAAKRNPDGIKQKLEKKEGLFRKNMMGKRVNFAARSVISPDPNIETNEIGVPPVFAKKLTYPEPVTNHNFYELKEAVLNGVEKWPGAAAIENENGQVINLRTKNFEERQALANQLLAPSNTTVTGARNKKVHRHLNNGDIVLMNRQPTLHKPSIMAHRARVLPGEKTIRMHYANCNTYNADFDGDEMNMHFPQNEIARAEALQIADTDHQYLAATAGKPLRGLIQDHISMGLWLTNRDTLFDREDYYQLLYGCLRPEDGQTASERIETVPSALVKPRVMWTGKQIITTVLKNITPVTHPGLTLLGRSQTSGDRWGEQSEEDIVMFQDSELLCGILDKAQLGPSGGGFIHSVYEAYGHTIAGKLLSVLGRLLTKLLNMRAFSCGVADLLLTERGEKNRLEQLKRADTIGLEVAAKYVTLENILDANDRELRSKLQDVLRDEEKQLGLDQVCNTQTAQLSSDITKACLPTGLQKPFPRNQMQAMTTSGAKGSSVNANLISCNLGQQVLEGRRVPVMVSGKTLPSFKPFETKVRAGGYITDRFLTGVKPQEYFFHAMAGREGLIDTAVKTSRSGYLQRCLIKGMEGLKSEYDNSVRDSDGSMVQFLYGEDGLDVTKQKHLTDFKFLAENYLSLVAQLNIKEEFSKLPDKGADEYQKAAMKLKKTGRIDALDPCLSVFDPGSSLGSTSDSFASALKAYCDKNPENLLKDRKKAPKAPISKKTFTALVNIKYMKSVIEPGEAVGVVAGQSIGEPSTQMTLNTFHLAGHSAKNVTLGIPRLREIVMTASRQMSTPTMTLHLIPELDAAAGEKFAKGITKLTMAEVIDNVNVSESIGSGIGFAGAKIYKVRLDLFPAAEYCETYAITVADVLRTVEVKFIPILAKAIKKELTRKGDAKLLKVSASQPEVGKSSGIVEDAPARDEADLGGGEDDEDDNGDDDATNNKQKQNRAEAISYAEPDDEEEAMARDAQRRSSPELEEPEDEGFGGSLRAPQGDDNSQMNGDDEEDEEQKFRSSITKEREFRIKEKTPSVTRFTFDDKSSQWCEIQLEYDITTAKMLLLPLVEKACHDAVIQSIPGLQACTVFKEKTHDPVTNEQIEVPVVLTQGVNLQAMHDYQYILNPHCIFTNDIAAMLTHYGVEACRATILREMDAVFKGHSISVDMRHLNLIADVMTRGGGFTPFNRNGLKSSVSPFMKMSFETTLGFLKDAVLEGDFDDLKNPSARIVMGKVGRVGTGAFDVLMPVDQ